MSELGILLVRFASILGLLGTASFAVFSVWLSAVDILSRRMPNRLVAWSLAATLGLLAASCLLQLSTASRGIALRDLLHLIGGVAALFLLFLLLWLLVPGGIGAGDVKIAPLAGGALGFFGAPGRVVIGVLVAFACAGAGGLLLRRGSAPHRDVPFAPCLFAGAWVGIVATTLASF